MRICDALGIFEISYVEGPESPISKVLGKRETVDTVRFPRLTLLVKAGDCDDTTALLAFDSGIPEEQMWFFKELFG